MQLKIMTKIFENRRMSSIDSTVVSDSYGNFTKCGALISFAYRRRCAKGIGDKWCQSL